jgi:hypothetical protein
MKNNQSYQNGVEQYTPDTLKKMVRAYESRTDLDFWDQGRLAAIKAELIRRKKLEDKQP